MCIKVWWKPEAGFRQILVPSTKYQCNGHYLFTVDSQYPVPVSVRYMVTIPESSRDLWIANHFEESHIATYEW